MFEFETEQKIFDIAGVRLGGQPGQLPTVMIGSIFHRGHGIIRDHRVGDFDKEEARHLIQQQDSLSEKPTTKLVPLLLESIWSQPESEREG